MEEKRDRPWHAVLFQNLTGKVSTERAEHCVNLLATLGVKDYSQVKQTLEDLGPEWRDILPHV